MQLLVEGRLSLGEIAEGVGFTDYNYFAQENNELYKKTLIIAAMAVIIIMLIFGEILTSFIL